MTRRYLSFYTHAYARVIDKMKIKENVLLAPILPYIINVSPGFTGFETEELSSEVSRYSNICFNNAINTVNNIKIGVGRFLRSALEPTRCSRATENSSPPSIADCAFTAEIDRNVVGSSALPSGRLITSSMA